MKITNKYSIGDERSNIKFITSYSSVYKTQAPMKFLPTSPTNLVAVIMDVNSGDFDVFYYTFTRTDIEVLLKEKEGELLTLILHEISLNGGSTKNSFTVDVEKMKVIHSEDFKSLSPLDFYYNAFIFDTNASEGFPNIYIQTRGEKHNKYLLGVQAFNSYVAMKPADKPTKFGKTLSFILTASVLSGKFTGDNFPDLHSIDIPSSTLDELPDFLDTRALDTFTEKCELHKIKRVGGKYVIEEDDPKEIVLVEAEEPDEKSNEDFYNEKEAVLAIQRSVLEKNSVNFSQILGCGVEKAISSIPLQNEIVDVNLDIHGIFKKMCLFEGKFYMILTNPENDWQFYLGNESDFFVPCSEETFPRKYLM